MVTFQPGQTVGIDLGTSYSAISVLGPEGKPQVLENRYRQIITPSMVTLGRGQVVTVGHPDQQQAANAAHIVSAVKRMMGNQNYFLVYEGRRVNADFISAMILRRLLIDAEAQIGEIGNAVITVPYYFNDPCRRATVNAGRIAGVNVLDLLNEPTAATLTYAWMTNQLGQGSESDPKTVLVYDLGGGTFDVTVVQFTPTQFQVLATDGDTLLGGLDWTQRIVDHVIEQIVRQLHFDPRGDQLLMYRITQACDQAKVTLSGKPNARIELVLHQRQVIIDLSRADFERMTADLLQRTIDTTELVLEQAHVERGRLHEVVLVGGSTHMPAVKAMLKRVTGREPSTILDPQLAVAQGAAIHAAMLEAREQGAHSRFAAALQNGLASVDFTDVNPHSLGIEITDSVDPPRSHNHIMIPKNHALPFSVTGRFRTTHANPGGIRIRLVEGEVSDLNACTFVGECRITGLPGDLPVGSPVEVTYSFDADRHVRVTARELTAGREASVEIDRQGSIPEGELIDFQKLAANYQAE